MSTSSAVSARCPLSPRQPTELSVYAIVGQGHVRTYPKDVLDGFNFQSIPSPDRCHQNLDIHGPIAIAWSVSKSEAPSTVDYHVAGQLPGTVNCRPGPFHGEIAVAWHLRQGHSAGTRRAHHRRSARENPRVDRRPHRRGARGRKGVELAVGVRSKSDWRVRVPLVQCKQRRRLLDATTAALRQGGPAWLQCSYIQSDVERPGLPALSPKASRAEVVHPAWSQVLDLELHHRAGPAKTPSACGAVPRSSHQASVVLRK